jgi:hypothetical protein
MHVCDALMFFVSYLNSAMLVIGNVVCEDKKTMFLRPRKPNLGFGISFLIFGKILNFGFMFFALTFP